MRTTHLKVKLKSLAAEARIIRLEESRARARNDRPTRLSLAEHRRGPVRREARHSLLAYAFIRGRPYRAVEASCHEAPDWTKVEDLIRRFGGYGDSSRFHNELEAWRA